MSNDALIRFGQSPKMKVLVIGATGGSGRAAVEQLLAAGHEVTAFSRRADKLPYDSDRFNTVNGNVMNQADVERAIRGHDAVIVTLGITENPVKVRLFGPSGTPLNVRSQGTQNVITAMQKQGVNKLIVQSSYGVGDTKDKLKFADKMIFKLLLKPQIADTEIQERIVRASGLDWVLAQPVHLTDTAQDAMPKVSLNGETGKLKVSRKSVGRFLADAIQNPGYARQSVAISG